MDVIGSHAARLPALDERWTPRAFGRAELIEGLLAGMVAGPEVTHPLDNVLRNIRLLHEGDPDKQFGLGGLQALDPDAVLQLVGRASGFEPDPNARTGPVPVDPEHGLLSTLLQRLIDRAGGEHTRAAQARLDDAAWVGWRLTELLPLQSVQRQALLQLDCPHRRLDHLLQLLP